MTSTLSGQKIVLAVTGSIAAFKSVMLYRELTRQGAEVRVILSHSAQEFVGRSSFTGFGAEVYDNMFTETGERHVELAAWADAIVVAPATADSLARIAHGRADELLTATLLCSRAEVFVAPAMHPDMWHQEATRTNLELLSERGVQIIGPVQGEVASGAQGMGRMLEPEGIAQELAQRLSKPLFGKRVLISAGPTREKIDAVRALTNLSSGKMGFALAKRARAWGAEVTLVAGPVQQETPHGVRRINVESALDMLSALQQELRAGQDCLVMAAAVADFRVAEQRQDKLKKEEGLDTLKWVKNPDLIATIAADRGGKQPPHAPLLVAFALESAEMPELGQLARKKLQQKGVDLVVANSAALALGQNQTQLHFVDAETTLSTEVLSKASAADLLLAEIARRLG